MVIDVEIYNDHIRQVKELQLNVEAVEEWLRLTKYSGNGCARDEAVEQMQLPSIAMTFYSYIYSEGRVPSDLALVEEYLNQSCFEYVPDGRVEVSYGEHRTIVPLDGLVGRILRTYPSLVRDFHFYLMARERSDFSAVRYSVQEDFKNGVDIKVQYGGKWYSIGLCLGSKRSLFFKMKKAFRHPNTKLIHIELYPDEAMQIGDYLLYTHRHIDKLIKRIDTKG